MATKEKQTRSRKGREDVTKATSARGGDTKRTRPAKAKCSACGMIGTHKELCPNNVCTECGASLGLGTHRDGCARVAGETLSVSKSADGTTTLNTTVDGAESRVVLDGKSGGPLEAEPRVVEVSLDEHASNLATLYDQRSDAEKAVDRAKRSLKDVDDRIAAIVHEIARRGRGALLLPFAAPHATQQTATAAEATELPAETEGLRADAREPEVAPV